MNKEGESVAGPRRRGDEEADEDEWRMARLPQPSAVEHAYRVHFSWYACCSDLRGRSRSSSGTCRPCAVSMVESVVRYSRLGAVAIWAASSRHSADSMLAGVAAGSGR
ncbi:hypothetical protein D3C81_1215560 [compost metagenome]